MSEDPYCPSCKRVGCFQEKEMHEAGLVWRVLSCECGWWGYGHHVGGEDV